ncbi:MAG TPA: hypothetical protein VFA18_19825, partial [Gemmataceae bacterium]|nr:hypothetical protein [Gemmataceae bacterium]
MRIQQFLAHYGLTSNPFSQEDAKEDLIFQKGCIDHTFHPQWGKIYGDPATPSAAVVLGERGSGKTALRLQIVEHLRRFNQANPDRRVLIIEYQDFNPFLDEFARRGNDLSRWTLNDHMDAILSLAVRHLVSALLGEGDAADRIPAERLSRLDGQHRRDLLMLEAVYDQSDRATRAERRQRLARALHYPGILGALAAKKEMILAITLTVVLLAGAIAAAWHFGPFGWLVLVPIVVAWIPHAKRWLWAWRLAGSINRDVR